MVLRTAD